MNTLTELIERMKITLEHSERGSLTFVVGDTDARRMILEPIRRQITNNHLSVFDVEASKLGLLEYLNRLKSDKVNVLILGLEKLIPERRKKFLIDVNFRRESLRETRKNLVFLVDQSTLDDFAQLAVDLWSIRSSVFYIPKQAGIIQSGIVRILDTGKKPVGSGFLIDENRLITCAHIVTNALKVKGISQEAPTDNLTVDFPLIEPNQLLQASVIAWIPKDDVAVLKIIGKPPSEAKALDLIDQPIIQGHEFRAFGFPTYLPNGIWASGNLNTDVEGKLLLEYSGTTGTTIQTGFSGGPVWDEALQGVVGMIQQTEAKPDAQVGLGVPIKRIVDSYKPLISLIPEQLDLTRQRYLDHILRTYHALDLRGIPQLGSFAQEMNLLDIYVPLLACPEMPVGETWERRLAGRLLDSDQFAENSIEKRPTFPVHMKDVLNEHQQIVILGDPGSGKSTLLKYLALVTAEQLDGILPILAPLKAFASFTSREPLSLLEFLPTYYKNQSNGLSNIESLFDYAISQGKALILLDGLDEVQSERLRLVQEIETFAAKVIPRGCKIIVTSRIVGYRDAPLALHWALYTLLDFDHNSIRAFAQKWCLAFETYTLGDTPESRANAQREYMELMAVIEANPGMAALASNPLLITILALIKRQGGRLTSRRVQLYDSYLETLTATWSKARSLDNRPVGPSLDYLGTMDVLAPLALWIHETAPIAGLVLEEDLLVWLTNLYKGEDWGLKQVDARAKAVEFLNSVHRYSNLLVERGPGKFGFVNLVFEEMLAARGLVQLGATDLQKSLALIQKYIADPAWREVILLAIGTWGIIQRQPRVAGEVVRRIMEIQLDREDKGANIIVAGQCLKDIGEVGIGRVVASEVQQALAKTNQDRSLSPIIQKDAGFLLGLIGWMPEDLDDFVIIHRGKFLFGKNKSLRIIENNYSIGKYPVTNLQFKRFVDAGGYDNEMFWSLDGWQWKTLHGLMQPMYWEDKRWNNPLTPVVGVTWYEAQAYCKWLSAELNRLVCLPSEDEWERVFRGKNGQDYPWGNKLVFDRLNCANYWGDHLSKASTTIVSQFPAGSSTEGVCDLCGNVWEWTSSASAEKIVIYGGSWKDDFEEISCESPRIVRPDATNTQLGFRVFSKL